MKASKMPSAALKKLPTKPKVARENKVSAPSFSDGGRVRGDLSAAIKKAKGC